MYTMNNPMIRMTGGLVDEDDSHIGRVNNKSLSGEIKSIIFDSFASLDDNNTDDCFGLDIETAMRAMEASPSRKQHQMYETLSSLTNVSSSFSYGEKPASRSDADDNTSSTNSVTSANDDSTKPKRPLSAYNLFFQLERERIIAGIDHLPFTADDVERVAIARRLSDMQPDKPKRKHRKSHGKITFAELARAIANRWRGLDAHSKGLLIERAALEKSRFLRDLEEWTKIHGADEEQVQDKARPKEVPIVAISSTSFEGTPPISQRATKKPLQDVPISQSRPPMHPPINRTVTPDTRMKCAMEMTAFANMRISSNFPASPMFMSRSMFNNVQASPNPSSFGNRLDSNMYRQYNHLPSLNAAIAARSQETYSSPQEDYSRFPVPNRTMSSRVREPMNASSLMHSNGRDVCNGQFPNEFAFGATPMSQSMTHLGNNDRSSSNMDQLLANVEYELTCSKVKGEKLSKLLETLRRENSNNNNRNNSYIGGNASQYM